MRTILFAIAAIGIAATIALAVDDARQRAVIADAWNVTGQGVLDGAITGGPGLIRLNDGDAVLAAIRYPMTAASCAKRVSAFTRGESVGSDPIKSRVAAYFVSLDEKKHNPLGSCFVLYIQWAPWRRPVGRIFLPDSAAAR